MINAKTLKAEIDELFDEAIRRGTIHPDAESSYRGTIARWHAWTSADADEMGSSTEEDGILAYARRLLGLERADSLEASRT